jgi:hypothetical protein
MVGTFSQSKSRRDKKILQDQIKRINANVASEKRARAGIDPADQIFQSALLKKITLAKAGKNDKLDFTKGSLRGL